MTSWLQGRRRTSSSLFFRGRRLPPRLTRLFPIVCVNSPGRPARLLLQLGVVSISGAIRLRISPFFFRAGIFTGRWSPPGTNNKALFHFCVRTRFSVCLPRFYRNSSPLNGITAGTALGLCRRETSGASSAFVACCLIFFWNVFCRLRHS